MSDLACSKACESGDPGVHHLDAPSGAQYDYRLLSIGDWIEFGEIPNPLLPIAVKHEWEGFDYSVASKEERRDYMELLYWSVAHMVEPIAEIGFVRGWRDSGTKREDGATVWERVSPAMPVEDRNRLWAVQLRPELIDLMSRFRDQQGSPGVPADGEGAGPVAADAPAA